MRGLGVLQARDFGRSQNISAKSCVLVMRRHQYLRTVTSKDEIGSFYINGIIMKNVFKFYPTVEFTY